MFYSILNFVQESLFIRFVYVTTNEHLKMATNVLAKLHDRILQVF